MGYMHIDNLYKNQIILLFRQCYALEKIHGTSAHIRWKGNALHFFSGGAGREQFEALFDAGILTATFAAMEHSDITVYGEAYGGKQQGQSRRYGPVLRFVVFDVKIGDLWLAVPEAAKVVQHLGLEFVHYRLVDTDLPALDAERDAPSEQARRNGVGDDRPREGIVLRPLIEVRLNNGARVIAKYKRDDERETTRPRKVVDPAAQVVLIQAEEIVEEWVTPMRLDHVLAKLGSDVGLARMRDVIAAMTEDVLREGAGELEDGREARRAIGSRTATLFLRRLKGLPTSEASV